MSIPGRNDRETPARAGIRSLAIACAVLFGGASVAGADAPEPLAPLRTADEFAALARTHEERLADDPQDYDALLGAANALISVMAIRSNGNLPRVDGLQDTDENRALWRELGPRALAHARSAQQLRPDSVEAAAAVATSYMFYTSSLGILSAIVKGAGGEYESNARRVLELEEAYGDGLGHTLLGGLRLVAPWPVRDLDEARASYERAAELAPDSARNQYSLGVLWARKDDCGRARSHFQRVLDMPCNGGSERLFCDWMKHETRRAIAFCDGGGA